MARRFLFVPGRWAAEERAICCDGIVAGAALQLSHWQGNATPSELAADTSTEIALRFVDSPRAAEWPDAPVLNNHFDTDGVLSVWTLLDPEAARERRALLVAAAEAGDFDAWPDDRRGLWLDAALRALVADCDGDAASYERALGALPALLDDIEGRRDLWGPEWQRIEDAGGDIDAGRLVVGRVGALGIVHHGRDVEEIPGPLLVRHLGTDCRRYLLVFERDAGLEYRYELPHHSWAETVARPRIAPPDGAALLRALGPDWTDADLAGMTEVARTRHPVQQPPDAVLEALRAADGILADLPVA